MMVAACRPRVTSLPGTGSTSRASDLVDQILSTVADRPGAELTILDATLTYQVNVTGSNAAAQGMGGCGTAAQTRAITGATSQTLEFVVYACGVGAGTVTAEVRRGGAETPEVAVSQGVTAEPIPAWVPDDDHPHYRDDVLVKGLSPREHTYTGLQHDATYKFRTHACNKMPACGWWTDPPLEVSTERVPTPQRPHTITFSQITSTSARVGWSAHADTGGVPLTGFDIEYWPYDPDNPDQEANKTAHAADDGNDRGETLRELAAGTEYALKMRACNGPKDRHCSSWSDDHRFTTSDALTQPDPGPTPNPPPPPVDIPDCGRVATQDHTAPTGLNVIPLSGHQVRLTWTGSTDSTGGYLVDIRPRGGTWPLLSQTVGGPNRIYRPNYDSPCTDFSITRDLGGGNDGLADNTAISVRIRAFKHGSPDAISESITIIDTPITKADGYVPESATRPIVGQADFTWTAVTGVLSDQYAGGKYILRYRRLTDNPASQDWRPSAFYAMDFGDTQQTSATEQSIAGLAQSHIYSVYLICFATDDATTADGQVFAARNVYVWPSSERIMSPGTVLATNFFGFPLLSLMSSNTYSNYICTDSLVACSDPSKRAFSSGYTTDIVLLRARIDHDPLAIPGGNTDVNRSDVSFDICPTIGRYTDWLPYDAQKNRGNSVHGTLVHEAGHAPGLRHPFGIDDRTLKVRVSSRDTVMTPRKTYNCFPHPLNVLAVYALHRGR